MRHLILSLLIALFLGAMPGLAEAQDSEKRTADKRIVIEIRDGAMLVDGEEVEADADGRIVIRRSGQDGEAEEIIIHRLDSEHGPNLFVGQSGERFEVRSDDGDERVMWFSNDGEDHPNTFTFGPEGERNIEVRRHIEDAQRAFSEARKRPFANVEIYRDGGNMGFFHDEGHSELLRGGALANRFVDFSGGPFEFLWQSDDEMAEHRERLRGLEREIRDVARGARTADASERAEQEAELDRLLDEALTLKQEMHELEIERMAQRLSELRERYEARQAERAEVIERRKRELLGRRDPLDW